jgi:hypothetical protein
MKTRCKDTPERILESKLCLSALSKDLEGELHLLERFREKCDKPECETLKTVHLLKLEVASHQPCDFPDGGLFDGTLYVKDLTHAFRDGDGNDRGVHAGNFRWRGAGMVAAGVISGITNAGTHREPPFDPCQTCDAAGFMEGSLCGTILRAKSRALVGCQISGAYRIRFDPSREGGQGRVAGTLEGALTCDCRREECADFTTFAVGSEPNPWTVGGETYLVRDHTGAPMASNEVRTDGGHTGLNSGFQLDVGLGAPASTVELTMVHFSSPASAEALSGGAVVAMGSMSGPQNMIETITLSAASIDSVVIRAPNNEALLLELCTRG